VEVKKHREYEASVAEVQAFGRLVYLRQLKDHEAERHVLLTEQHLQENSFDNAFDYFQISRDNFDTNCSKYFTRGFVEKGGPWTLFNMFLEKDMSKKERTENGYELARLGEILSLKPPQKKINY